MFVYCVLGSQANVQNSILNSGGQAKKPQCEFVVLVENSAKSVQRYQLAVDEVKIRLNLAVFPGAWLIPRYTVNNTESTVGYNQLKQATQGMKLGINHEVNQGTNSESQKIV